MKPAKWKEKRGASKRSGGRRTIIRRITAGNGRFYLFVPWVEAWKYHIVHAPAQSAGGYQNTELLENCLYVQSVTGYKGGTLPRVHLVMDCLVNDWLREIFDQQVDTVKQVEAPADGRPSKEDQVKIIAELKRMNTPASLALAATMEQEGKI